MKKLFFTVLGALSTLTAAVQAQTSDANTLYLYGVDFSTVKTYAANETPEQFATAFTAINQLLLTEPSKYDFSRILGQRAEVIVDPMIERASKRDYATLHTQSQQIEPIQIESIIKDYTLPQHEGTGFVLIARLLNKATGEGTYEMVAFDIASRKVLYNETVKAKAGGFGLRNFWANTIYRITKGNKIYFDK